MVKNGAHDHKTYLHTSEILILAILDTCKMNPEICSFGKIQVNRQIKNNLKFLKTKVYVVEKK